MLLNILLTGAAGLVGGEVAARLAAAGHRVTAFLRREPVVRAHDGAPVAVAETVLGDIALPGLGLTETVWNDLAARHDMVVHCAATVRFDLADADYAAVNVEGTRRVAELARAGDMRMLHVSTAYSCGARDGPIREDDPLPAQRSAFTNGYEASKAAGEQVVRGSGVPFVIARPSIVTGHSQTGAIRQFDTTYALFRLLAEGRVARVPARADASFDFVPIDHVAAGIAALVEQFDRAAGAAYNLVAQKPLPVRDFIAAIADYPQFSTPHLVDPAEFDADALPVRERRLYRRGIGPYAAYFARNPRFDDRRFRAVTGVEAPAGGATYFRRLVDYCIAHGFLQAEPVS